MLKLAIAFVFGIHPIFNAQSMEDKKPDRIQRILIPKDIQERRKNIFNKGNSIHDRAALRKNRARILKRRIEARKKAYEFNPEIRGRFDTAELLRDSIKETLANHHPQNDDQVIDVKNLGFVSFVNQLNPGRKSVRDGDKYLAWSSKNAYSAHALYAEISPILTEKKVSIQQFKDMKPEGETYIDLLKTVSQSFSEAGEEYDYYQQKDLPHRKCDADWAKKVKIIGKIPEMDLVLTSLVLERSQTLPSWQKRQQCPIGLRVVFKRHDLEIKTVHKK